MFEIFAFFLFVFLFGWCIKIAFKLAWGAAKIVAVVLLVLAVPALIVCFIIGASAALIAPVCMLVGAATLLRFFSR